jgi:hypothetical protein
MRSNFRVLNVNFSFYCMQKNPIYENFKKLSQTMSITVLDIYCQSLRIWHLSVESVEGVLDLHFVPRIMSCLGAKSYYLKTNKENLLSFVNPTIGVHDRVKSCSQDPSLPQQLGKTKKLNLQRTVERFPEP